jgi:hypothetical protein
MVVENVQLSFAFHFGRRKWLCALLESSNIIKEAGLYLVHQLSHDSMLNHSQVQVRWMVPSPFSLTLRPEALRPALRRTSPNDRGN